MRKHGCSILTAIVLLGGAGCSTGEAQPRAWLQGRDVCVAATDTIDLAPERQAPGADALPGCRTWPRWEVVEATARSLCGPCGFAFDRAASERARRTRPTACCYSVSSPPPPG